jgi:hypothetical protein
MMTMRRGGADAHSELCERHWMVYSIQNDCPKVTLHIFPGMKDTEFFNNGGKEWKGHKWNNKGFNIE